MPLKQSYAIWNNKGGVGKSTITFHLSTRYSEKNPEKNILVIDLCPQSNVSMTLLGGGTTGEQKVMDLCKDDEPKTVVGYLGTVIGAGSGAALPNPMDWVIKVNDHNKEISENVYLLCGDGNLEPMAPLISDRASAPALTPTNNPWKWVHLVMNKFIEKIAENSDKEWVVFIDTNPSFSIYTEIALSSAKKIIVPVNADDSSRVAIKAMFTLLHGSEPPHPIYGKYTFAEKAKASSLSIPHVHMIIGNRLTQHDGAATAFEAMTDATAESLYSEYQNDKSRFSHSSNEILDLEQFKNSFSVPLRDFNSTGVVAAHLGKPLSHLKQTKEGYSVHDSTVKVDKRRVNECEQALDEIIKRI